MLYLPSAGKLFIPVHRTGYSSFEDFINLLMDSLHFFIFIKELNNTSSIKREQILSMA
jgi:hypothetical protein